MCVCVCMYCVCVMKKKTRNYFVTLVCFSLHHKYKDAANTISRFISLIASLNLFSRSVFPIPFAAWHSCRSTSSKRRMHLIIDPEMSFRINIVLYREKNVGAYHYLNIRYYRVSCNRMSRDRLPVPGIILSKKSSNQHEPELQDYFLKL